MNHPTSAQPIRLADPLQRVVPPAEGPASSVAADRMYQLAALTAGLFLLVTLL